MEKVTIAAAQYPITRHTSFEGWKSHTRQWIREAKFRGAQLAVFPEYGSLELTSLMNEEIQQSLPLQLEELQKYRDDFVTHYIALAREQHLYILTPSFPWREGKVFVNRTFFISPTGEIGSQDKQVMTRFEDEEWHISAGDPLLKIFETSFGKVGINICYDGEFPSIAEKLAEAGLDILLHPSCTEGFAGMHRVHVGAVARALENQCYVVVSQTVGEALWSPAVDKNTGMAVFYAPCDHLFPADGILRVGELNEPSWVVETLDLALIKEIRKHGQVLNFHDRELLKQRSLKIWRQKI